jgi:serine phosphatase RsbU (regulator of sigma subunit)
VLRIDVNTLASVEYKQAKGLTHRVALVVKGKDSVLYAAGSTQNGHYLFKYDPASDRFTDISLPLPKNTNFDINDLWIEPSGKIWLATSQGLFVQEEKQLRHIPIKELGDFLNIKAIFRSESGIFWLSTEKGLLKNQHQEFYVLDEKAGLPTGTMTFRALTENKQGTLWAGSAEGLVRSSPYVSIRTASTLPPILLGFEASKPTASANTFDYQTDLSARFITLMFPNEKMFYRYRLVGLNTDWVALGNQNQLTLQRLPAGKYTLEISARQEGLYSWSAPLRITFKVQQAWYLSAAAWLVYILLTVILLVAIIRAYTWRLRVQRQRLQEMVEQRTEKIQQQTVEISAQRDALSQTIKDLQYTTGQLTASIQYASRIQQAMLPTNEAMTDVFGRNNFFVFYQARDIVSGDFYWLADKRAEADSVVIAAADCTGHGVPGALMSMIGIELLNRIVHDLEVHEPDLIAKMLNIKLLQALRPHETQSNDGMDVALVTIHLKEKMLYFSGAYATAYLVQNNQIQELKGSRIPIGGSRQVNKSFDLISTPLEGSAILYLTSDGYRDQIGGHDLRKLTSGGFRHILLKAATLPFGEQKTFFEEQFLRWKGDAKQIDDVMVLGISLNI